MMSLLALVHYSKCVKMSKDVKKMSNCRKDSNVNKLSALITEEVHKK